MTGVVQPVLEWAVLVQRELLLFVAVFFAIGSLDELVVDLIYLGLRLRGRHEVCLDRESELAVDSLAGKAAVLIPAWQEHAVIGATVAHALSAWTSADLRLYVGCYRNDPETIASAMAGGRGDPRLRIVIHDSCGPTTKSDCLNRLYRAIVDDEMRSGEAVRMVVLQDAEDMVDPAALRLCDQAIGAADLVQLPVVALPCDSSPLIASHYSDEFADSHARTMVVRDAIGAAIPGAGVGCAIARPMLTRLAEQTDHGVPFAPHALTEDYELGQRIARLGGRTRFLRARAEDGRIVATRAYFPARLEASVRQKTRWIHGIALQSWDRLGWSGSLACQWMQLRDRRGPLAALVLAAGYLIVLLTLALWSAEWAGLLTPPPYDRELVLLIFANGVALVWRMVLRSCFTTIEHGPREGALSVPRIFVSNLVAILAGRRAVLAYIRTLRGAAPVWDKTEHEDHPALSYAEVRPA